MELHDVLATAASLSPASRRFLEYALETPAANRPLDYSSSGSVGLAPETARDYQYPLQSWPVLVGPEKLRQLARASYGVTELIKSIPRLFFKNDPRKIASFYELQDEATASLLLTSPDGLDGALARCDLIDTPAGLRCIEVNLTANLGGWQMRLWKDKCLQHPPNRRFFAEERLAPVYRDPLEEFFRHVIEEAQGKPYSADGELNVMIVVPHDAVQLIKDLSAHLNALYGKVLGEQDKPFRGKVSVTHPPGNPTIYDGAKLRHDGMRIHVWLDLVSQGPPPAVFRSFKARALALYNSPLAVLLDNKVNFALLSEYGESPLFDQDQQDVIREHVPWSRRVRAGAVTFRGVTADLLELALKHQSELVLKAGSSMAGEAVYIGRQTPVEAWRGLLRSAFAEEGWLIQEHLESRPYLFQRGAAGTGVHDVIWGIFCFGRRYGGGFLRMMSRDSSASKGVINSARGAVEGFIFEV